MQITVQQAQECVEHIIKAGLVPYLHGSPGCGKSDVIKQIAKKYRLKLIDIRLSQIEPCEINGFPQIKDGVAHYVPMDLFPLENAKIPEGYDGWLIFLDEMNSGSRATQSASYKLVLDRMVGQHHLHKNVVIACAGNLDTDGAITEELSTALQSRMIHLEVMVDKDAWVKWAYSNDIDPIITSFIEFKPSNLYTFNPDSTDKTYACPRTYEFLNKLMKVGKVPAPVVIGTIGEGAGREFMAFMEVYKDLPAMDAILKNPDGIYINREPSVLFALTGALASYVNENNIKQLMVFVERLPVEFQILILREIKHRNEGTGILKHITSWIVRYRDELI